MTRLLVAVSCALLLSGCSESFSMTESPPVSTSPSSAAPTATGTPERETPEEFVRRWVAADTHMQTTGDGGGYRELSAKCSNCLEYADYIEGIWKAGGYIKTRGWIVSRVRVSGPLNRGWRDVTIDVVVTPAEFVEESGGKAQRYDRAELTYIVTLKPTNDAWQTLTFAQVAE